MKQHTTLLSTFFLLALLAACKGPEPIEPPLTYEDQVVAYFKNVALGFENGNASQITRKWLSPMRIYVAGDTSDQDLMAYIDYAIEQINSRATDGFSIQKVNDSLASNTYLMLGSRGDFISFFPDAEADLEGNLALFNVWWNFNIINRARIFIDTRSTNRSQQRSLVLEEIAQSLGLGRDSPQYPESIFYETATDGGFAQDFSDLDRDLIRLL
ncbi:MAG: DUF2927 domain-containing protein, partial [Bacteroidota bacterium]